MKRSVSTELNLEPGNYTVLMKITAMRNQSNPSPEEVIRKTCRTRREKLLTTGLSYDLAHAKGQFRQLEKEEKKVAKMKKFEKQKAQAKKMHDARNKERKKGKLRQAKLELKRQEKMERRLEKEAAIQQSSRSGTPDPSIEQRFDELKLEEPENVGGGLGITVNGEDKEGRPLATVLHRSHRSDTVGSLGGTPPLTAIGRPGTPPRSAPRRDTQPRRDTLPPSRPNSPFTRPTRRGTLSPLLPDIRVQRPSMSSHRLSLNDISDDELSWDSEADGPEPPESDESGAEESLADDDPLRSFLDKPRGGRDEDSEEDEFEADPWNAVCVVGLRVYSEQSGVGIKVVKPGDNPDSMSPLGRKGPGEMGPDVDDSAADAIKSPIKESLWRPLEEIGSLPANIMSSTQG